MTSSTPHYLLFSQVGREGEPGWWRFTLESTENDERFEATDAEPNLSGERLQLLTLIRALESLNRPSDVTVVFAASYVRQGICFGLPEWKANGWRWEYYGQMVPIKDCDLWQRLDRAMQFHRVDFRRWRVDSRHALPQGPKRVEKHVWRNGLLMLGPTQSMGTWAHCAARVRVLFRLWMSKRGVRRLTTAPG